LKKKTAPRTIENLEIKAALITKLLRVTAAVSVVALVPSAYLAAKEALWAVFAADAAAFAAVLCLAFIPRLPYRIKAISFSLLTYALGVALLIYTGPFGAGELFIFGFVFLASLFGRARAMVFANALAILTHALFAVAAAAGMLPWDQGLDSVVVISVNFILVSVFLSVAANYLVAGLEAAYEKERGLKETLESMLREIEHRVKNNLQVISGLVNLRSKPGSDPARALADIRESLSAISVVHRLLYRRGSFSLVELKALLGSLFSRFRAAHEGIEFDFSWEGPEFEIDNDLATSMGLLVNEIVVNSIAHAFPHGRKGRIFLNADHDEAEETLFIVLGDDGAGMDQGGPGGEGLGIIRALAGQLGAEMEILHETGLRFQFRIDTARLIVPGPGA
jgi:two-component sensor histidine kinase